MQKSLPMSMSSGRLLAALAVGALIAAAFLIQGPALLKVAASPKALPVSTPCTSAHIVGSPATPQEPRSGPVTLTASSTNCTSPEYRYFLLAPGSSIWVAKTAYTTSATYNWVTTGAKPGTWQIGVWARQVGSGARYQAYSISTFALVIPYCTSAYADTGNPSPQAAGTTNHIAGGSYGCPEPWFEFWVLAPGSSTWVVFKPYTYAGTGFTDMKWPWDTTGAKTGAYRWGVWARQTGSSHRYDAYAILTFWVT